MGVGSNLGDRWANLRRGLEGLRQRGLGIGAVSSVWETEPVGCEAGSPWFLNLVASVETALAPLDLLDVLLGIEAEAGRVRRRPGESRILDLDLLLFGQLVLEHPRLVLPHPRLRHRRFVLAPLAEIAPAERDPITGLSIEDLLARLDDPHRVRRVGTIARISDPSL